VGFPLLKSTPGLKEILNVDITGYPTGFDEQSPLLQQGFGRETRSKKIEKRERR
jgi:hypothetical protein